MSRYSNELGKNPYQGGNQNNNYMATMTHSPNRLPPSGGYPTARGLAQSGINPMNRGIFSSQQNLLQSSGLMAQMGGYQAMGQVTNKSLNLTASQNTAQSQYLVPPMTDKINILLKENEKLSNLLDEKTSENEKLRIKLNEKKDQSNSGLKGMHGLVI